MTILRGTDCFSLSGALVRAAGFRGNASVKVNPGLGRFAWLIDFTGWNVSLLLSVCLTEKGNPEPSCTCEINTFLIEMQLNVACFPSYLTFSKRPSKSLRGATSMLVFTSFQHQFCLVIKSESPRFQEQLPEKLSSGRDSYLNLTSLQVPPV